MDNEIQGRPAAPDAQKWLDYLTELKMQAPARYEDAAKFLVTIISITITLLFTSFEKLSLLAPKPVFLFIILVAWFAALLLAFWVLHPRTYHVPSQDIRQIKSMQETIIKRKQRLFIAAVSLYCTPLAVLVLFYLLYISSL